MPLTFDERALIRRAENEPWTPDLEERLRLAVARRGVHVSLRDNVGDLVKSLELVSSEAVAKGEKEQR